MERSGNQGRATEVEGLTGQVRIPGMLEVASALLSDLADGHCYCAVIIEANRYVDNTIK
jgi:hypothetical protein